MSTKTAKAGYEAGIEGAEGVAFTIEDSLLHVEGPLGKCVKDFSKIPVSLKIEGSKILVSSTRKRRAEIAIVTTACSLIKKMIIGVTEGFTYRLKIVFAHFPVSVKIKGREVHVENFYGERSPRVAKILGECKANVDGDDIVVQGVSLEDVGQTAANIEQATRVKRKDHRVFLDGVYVYVKQRGWGK